MKLLKVGVEVNQVRANEPKSKSGPAGNKENIQKPQQERETDGQGETRFPSIPNFQLSFDIDREVRPTKDFRNNIRKAPIHL